MSAVIYWSLCAPCHRIEVWQMVVADELRCSALHAISVSGSFGLGWRLALISGNLRRESRHATLHDFATSHEHGNARMRNISYTL